MSPSGHAPRRALVAGAGGFLGSAVVRALTEDGWNVRGLVRKPASARRVEEAGGFPVTGDILDVGAVDAASRGCELLVHLAAGDAYGPGGLEGASRVRVEGARHLLRAARQHGSRRVVIGSGYWVYADEPGTITESSALDPRGESAVNRRTEETALDAGTRGAVEVLVVRPGMVYGNGSWFRGIVDAIRTGSYRVIEDGSNPWSFVALEDAGSGFARIAGSGEPGQIYNLVDGQPLGWRTFVDHVAERMARPHPGSLTRSEAIAEFGEDVAHHLGARRACSADKVRSLGWNPRYSDVREGLVHLMPAMRATDTTAE